METLMKAIVKKTAFQLIQEAKENESIFLSLRGMGLTSLPPELWELKKLQYLYLRGNKLTSLPFEVLQLQRLTTLCLEGNRISRPNPIIRRLKQANVEVLF